MKYAYKRIVTLNITMKDPIFQEKQTGYTQIKKTHVVVQCAAINEPVLTNHRHNVNTANLILISIKCIYLNVQIEPCVDFITILDSVSIFFLVKCTPVRFACYFLPWCALLSSLFMFFCLQKLQLPVLFSRTKTKRTKWIAFCAREYKLKRRLKGWTRRTKMITYIKQYETSMSKVSG